MSALRTSKSLPVHIVEQHNDAVPPIHRAVASRLLPFSGAAMVHLDSHPDLLLPIHMTADTVFKPAELYESLSIENWVLPLVYAKHIDMVFWIKPPWARQIPVSTQTFLVGQCSQSDTIRVTSKENYFLTDGLFRSASELVDASTLTLQVEEVLPKAWQQLDSSYKAADVSTNPNQTPSGELTQPAWIERISNSLGGKSYILDIDLDFFSTANPFLKLLEKDEEIALRRLYCYKMPSDLSDESLSNFTKGREDQLDLLEELFSNLEEQRLKIESEKDQPSNHSDVSTLDYHGLAPPIAKVVKSSVSKGLNENRIEDLILLCHAVMKRNSKTLWESSVTPSLESSAPSIDQDLLPITVCQKTDSDQADPHSALPDTLLNQSAVHNVSSSKQCPPSPQAPSSASCSQPSTLTPSDPSEDLTFLQLHDYGCTLDDTELPHHLSSPAQVKALMSEVKIMFEALPRPALVTIARSSEDGYCPTGEVDRYEQDTLRMLQEVFGTLNITRHYDS